MDRGIRWSTGPLGPYRRAVDHQQHTHVMLRRGTDREVRRSPVVLRVGGIGWIEMCRHDGTAGRHARPPNVHPDHGARDPPHGTIGGGRDARRLLEGYVLEPDPELGPRG